MSRLQLGSFEVLERIASGGMGDIWRGVHIAQRIPAAIKVIRRTGVEDLHFKRLFRREVQAVAQLDHPGIITLFDIGEVPKEVSHASAATLEVGSPYLIMHYFERGSLESLECPLPWPETRAILMAVLDGLAHAHARGITHRDLKPGNILIADRFSGFPIRLTDFGIAFSYRESRPKDAEDTAAGTPTYMAPEQFLGEWRDFGPWTDLYALGCVAYELASGRVPFTGDDVLRLGVAHLDSQPPELDCSADYPDGFESWVMKLLEKDPARRYRRCANAAAALESLVRREAGRRDEPIGSVAVEGRHCTTTCVPMNAETATPESDWRVNSTLRRPFKIVGAGLGLFGLRTIPMVDRDSERDLMWEVLRRVARLGTPGLVVLEGSAGEGKSRLAEWLCERAHEMGFAEYLRAEHNPSRGRESGLSHMLATAWSCLGTGAEELQNRVASRLRSAGIYSHTMLKAVAELLAPGSLGEDYRPGTFHEFGSRSERFSTLFEVLRRVYDGMTLIVCLEDVHWATDALHFVRFALDRSQGEPIRMMAILTVRDDLLVESTEAFELLRMLCLEESAECIHVGPLSEGDTRMLVGSLLYLKGDLAGRVAARSAGNPLYATQLVGDWVNRGILQAGASGFVVTGADQPEVPDDVVSVWVRRLERVLDECTGGGPRSPSAAVKRIEAQIVLELAAALGGTVDMAEWTSVCSRAGITDPTPVLESMLASRLARLGIDGWAFSHSMLRDSIERIAREKRRWAFHNRLCAEMLEHRHPVPRWGDSERIGRHRFEAGQFQAATQLLLRGARERMRLEEYAAALELLTLCDGALNRRDRPDDDPWRLESALLKAEINCTRLELEDAEQLARQVRDLTRDDGTSRFYGPALLVLARVDQHRGQLRTALDEFSEAQHRLRTTGPKHKLAACLSEQAHAMLETNLLDESWAAFNEAQEIYEDIGELIPWAENQLGLAGVALLQGFPGRAAALGRRVRAFARREGLNRIEAAAWAILSETAIAEGQRTDAVDSLDRSIGLFEQLGLSRQALRPRVLKTLLLLESGSVDQAKVEFQHLRNNPETEIPRGSELLMSCVGLAVAADGSAQDFQSSFDQTAALLRQAEVRTSDVVRCLHLAVKRADNSGFPGRSELVKQLGAVEGP